MTIVLKKEICALWVVLVFAGCGGNTTHSTQNIQKTKELIITDAIHVESLGTAQRMHVKVALGQTPKDVYVVLTNNAQEVRTVRMDRKNKLSINNSRKIVQETTIKDSIIKHIPSYVEGFKAKVPLLLRKKIEMQNQVLSMKKNLVTDIKDSFYLYENSLELHAATMKKSISVSTRYGRKKLKIWVSHDSFGSGCAKARCVTKTMVDALADTFLKAGDDNDIYDWITNIYGEEWGLHHDTTLINQQDEITIFLTDINGDNSIHGGVLGYFYAKDNFKKSVVSGSNERLMFYADSVLFANGDGEWDINDFWPKEMISTLAHEFQHMIHFYQKTVLRTHGVSTDTWIDEMLSESTEDIIANKIKHTGPRGVDYRDGSAGKAGNTKGRYPQFNANNGVSLTTWSNRISDYSKVSAFGAFLLRNYGGAQILHDIMYNDYVDTQALLFAIAKQPFGEGKNLDTLIKEWGIAVLLSDHDDLVDFPHYNRGDYIPNLYNNVVYQLGSIDFFNYSPQPNVLNSAGNINPKSNYYYRIGKGLSGDISFDLSLEDQIEATVIIK